MVEEQLNPETVAREHAQVSADIKRLGNIATELDEIGEPFTVAQWASRVEERPRQLLAQFHQLITSFEKGLTEHFAREERYLPELTRRLGSPAVAESLLSDHRRMSGMLRAICDRVRDLASSQLGEESKQAQLHEVTKTLRDLTGQLQGHADKEDEVLFIMGHNT